MSDGHLDHRRALRGQCRSFDLYMHARHRRRHLRGSGAFIGKIFQGRDFDQAKKRTEALFTQTRVMKPDAARRM
jgi:23S rRNA U2552 (ribose-2'-O)-methylase RlmE/FtsJ